MEKEGKSMKQFVQAYCATGENCAFAILHAAATKYKFDLSKELKDSCAVLQAGFGICGTCGALVASLMVLGILFSEDDAKRIRLFFFLAFQEKYHGFDCKTISADRTDCMDVMLDIAELLEQQIKQNMEYIKIK